MRIRLRMWALPAALALLVAGSGQDLLHNRELQGPAAGRRALLDPIAMLNTSGRQVDTVKHDP
jgi:hypothetical protein